MSVTVQKWNGPAILAKLEKQAKNGLINLANLIRDDAKINVRKDTLRLMNSLSVNWSGSGKGRIPPSGAYSKGATFRLYNNRISKRDMESVENDGVGEPAEEDGKFVVVIGTNVKKYAVHQEYNSLGRGRPYLRPAINRFSGERLKIPFISIDFYAKGYTD